MQRCRSQLLQCLPVLLGPVTLMGREAVARPAGIKALQESITPLLGENAGASDGEAVTVTCHHTLLRPTPGTQR